MIINELIKVDNHYVPKKLLCDIFYVHFKIISKFIL